MYCSHDSDGRLLRNVDGIVIRVQPSLAGNRYSVFFSVSEVRYYNVLDTEKLRKYVEHS